MKIGTLLHEIEGPEIARNRCQANLTKLHPSILRLANPHRYPAGLELTLNQTPLDWDGIHYEPRWIKPWPVGITDLYQVGWASSPSRPAGILPAGSFESQISLEGDSPVPIGDLVLDIGGIRIGFEICEDAWVADRPGARLADRAADLILNPSASHFAFGKAKINSHRPMLPASADAGIVRENFAWPAQPADFTGTQVPKHGRTEEDEFTRAVALGLFDYLRKSRSSGFMVSLSGGADSAAVACLVRLMADLAVAELGPDAAGKLPSTDIKQLLPTASNRSEAAVGYATMDGDTADGLAPVSGIDKNFLRHWLRWLGTTGPEINGSRQPIPLLAVINQQSPTAELRPQDAKQTDEDDLMPYDVLDFIERMAIRDHHAPQAVLELLENRFPEIDSYSGFHDNGRRHSTGMAGWLRGRGVTRVTVCGLATG